MDPPLCRERSWNRLLVTEGLVRTRFLVKADVLGDDAAEVILTEDEDVVEQLSPERTGEAFWPAARAAESDAARTRGILRDASEEWSRAG